jgi:cation:H+ antiporter
MLTAIAAVVAGLTLLVWSADRFVIGASATARNLGISPMIIGLTIVGFGTSAPEMLVSAVASFEDRPGIAIGNAIGSNIANIALVLAVAALIAPLTVTSTTLRREMPVLLLIMIFAFALMLDGDLTRGDGIALIAGLGLMIWWLVRLGMQDRNDPIVQEYLQEMPAGMTLNRALLWVAAGLLLLFVSSRLLVWGAVEIAVAFGISDLVIGLTIIAIGTSLPELAAAIAGVLKKEHDIAIGNVIGSNMFNLLAVLGMPALIAPGALDPELLTRDYSLMVVLTLALLVMARGFRGRPGRVNRIEGAVLLAVFFAWLAVLYQASM